MFPKRKNSAFPNQPPITVHLTKMPKRSNITDEQFDAFIKDLASSLRSRLEAGELTRKQPPNEDGVL